MRPAPCAHRTTKARHDPEGFTIIELLTVILIITLVVAITVPALASARKAARKAETLTQLSAMQQAVESFVTDNRRAPGYFSQVEMGDMANSARGFSPMQNILLDLIGGEDSTSTVMVGPTPTAVVKFRLEKLGTGGVGNKNYFVPGKALPALVDQSAGGTFGTPRIADAAHQGWDLYDAFGSPILAWAADRAFTKQIAVVTEFSRENSNGGRAVMYEQSNSSFIDAVALGKKSLNQKALSLLSTAVVSNTGERLRTLTGLVGNPSSPGNLAAAAANQAGMQEIYPTATRGAIVLHSAGEDGVYLSTKDKGSGKCRPVGAGAVMDFGLNFRDLTGSNITSTLGKGTNTDIVSAFDDIVVGAGS